MSFSVLAVLYWKNSINTIAEIYVKKISAYGLWSSEIAIVASFVSLIYQLYFQYEMPVIALPVYNILLFIVAFPLSILVRASVQSFFLEPDFVQKKKIFIKQIIYVALFSCGFWVVDGLYGTWFGFISVTLMVLLWIFTLLSELLNLRSGVLSDVISMSRIRFNHAQRMLSFISEKISE